MENLHQTQQLIIDLRRAKEADAHRYRLVKRDRVPASLPAVTPRLRRHRVAGLARHSLART
jgi:hypothetical protein